MPSGNKPLNVWIKVYKNPWWRCMELLVHNELKVLKPWAALWNDCLAPAAKCAGCQMSPLRNASGCDTDCCTVITWWLQDCHWGMRHGLEIIDDVGYMTGWSKYRLDTPHLHWITCKLQCIMGLCDRWEFPCFFSQATDCLLAQLAFRAVQENYETV